ncbi:MAG: YihY/virulence factor BrkB family protein [Burkholderiaceae bacterium]|nr:YihY/virulence factor BrkB family protein [Burkholderiaceae bacterium]
MPRPCALTRRLCHRTTERSACHIHEHDSCLWDFPRASTRFFVRIRRCRTGQITHRGKVKYKHSLKEWWQLVRAAVTAWIDDYAPSMGAALSYYTVFSLAPMLLIVISVAGLIFGGDAVRGELFGQLRGLMGRDAAKAVEELLSSVSQPSEGIAGTVIGIVFLLVGATTVFGELQDALDRIWRAPAREKTGGLWGLLRARLLSFGMILGVAFLLMVSLVFGAAVAALGKWWSGAFGNWETLAQIVNVLVGFVVTTVGFALIYKFMPRVKVHWHDVFLGAAVTALLFTIGRFLIGLYIGKSGIASGFGAAGSLVIIFVWVYYSAQIFLLGAEFTWVYARTFGSMRTAESENASASVAAPAAPTRSDSNENTAPTYLPLPVPRRREGSLLKQVGAGVGLLYLVNAVAARVLRQR